MKKFISILLTVILILNFKVVAFATVADGTSGNITWSYDDETRVLTLSGSGEMLNYTYSSSSPWLSTAKNATSIVIDEGITTVGNYAFYNLKSVTTISLPSTLKKIGEDAFCYSAISELVLPEGLESIGNSAFEDCYSLVDIQLPESLQTISASAFAFDKLLKEIFIPENVSSIGKGAFNYCSSLYSIDVDENNAKYCSVEGVLFDKSMNNLIVYPAAKNAKEYTIPEPVNTINEYAFISNSYLTKLTISKNVKSINDYSFSSDYKLTEFVVDESNTDFSSINGLLCNSTGTILYKFVSNSSDTTYTLPSSIHTINSHAFTCNKNTKILFADDVTTIKNYAFTNDGLNTVYLRGNVTSVEKSAFWLSSLSKIVYDCSNTSIPSASYVSSGVFSPEHKYTYNGATKMICTSCGKEIEIENTITTDESIQLSYSGSCDFKWTIKDPTILTKVNESSSTISYGSTYKKSSTATFSPLKLGVTAVNVEYPESTILAQSFVLVVEGEHNYSLTETITEPTCTDDGLATYTCKYCGETITKPIPALGHEYTTLETVLYDSTCSTEGKKQITTTCSRCDYCSVEDQTIAKKEHTYVIDAAVAATCTENGLAEGQHCSVCNYVSKEQTTVLATGHSYVNGTCTHCGKSALSRIAGIDRYETAVEISRVTFPNGSKNVILVNGLSFPDALAATPLAYLLDAPVLMQNGTAAVVNQSTMAEIERLGATNIYIMGGTGAVSSAVEASLQKAGYIVHRIADSNRYGTAAAIADTYASQKSFDTVVIACGLNYPDALGAGSAAAINNMPILFVNTNSIPDETVKVLDKYGVKNAIIVGGTGVVSTTVEMALNGKGISVTRLAGSDRFETSVAIAKYFFPTATTAVTATGMSFADALAGGVAAAKASAPILLVNGTGSSLPASIQSYIKNAGIQKMSVLGGTGAVSEKMTGLLKAQFN